MHLLLWREYVIYFDHRELTPDLCPYSLFGMLPRELISLFLNSFQCSDSQTHNIMKNLNGYLLKGLTLSLERE